MSRRIIKGLFYSIASFLISSCEQKISYVNPDYKDKFVLYAELDIDEVITLNVDRTYPVPGQLIYDLTFLQNTVVMLYEDDKPKAQMLQIGGSSKFVAPNALKPEIGKKYHFEVSAKDFTKAVSMPIQIPPKVNLSKVVVSDKKVISSLNPDTPAVEIIATIENDSKQVGSYILFEVKPKIDNNEVHSIVIFGKQDVEFGDPCIYLFKSDKVFLNSKCYNKARNNISIIIEKKGFGLAEIREVNNVEVSASYVSQEFYDFYNTFNPPDGVFRAFENIDSTNSYIEGGYGAVFSKYTNTKTVKIN